MIPVRRATVLDIPEMVDIAGECYRRQFDPAKALAWGETAMFNPKMVFVRSKDAWGCAGLVDLFYEQRPKGMMLFLAARRGKAWQACAVLKGMIEWCRSKNAGSFDFGEETGMDLSVLAKRVGAATNRPSYRVELANPLKDFWMRAA